MHPHLADANELCIQEMDVNHIVVARPTPSLFYRGLFTLCVGYLPTKKLCSVYLTTLNTII